MTKCIILICTLFAGSSFAQVNDTLHGALYPFRDKSGKFGYADENLSIKINSQYKKADVFTKQGFAVITDSLDRKGVIDKRNNMILPADYEHVRLFTLEDFTLAEAYKTYFTRWRFWEWKFLPGFSITGGGSDKRLFDTKVERVKKTIFILGKKTRKVRSKRITDKSYTDKYFKIKALDNNHVLVDDRLYRISAKKGHLIASRIKNPLSSQTFAQQKKRRLHIVDKKGRKVNGKTFQALDSIPFALANKQMMTPIGKSGYKSIASVYEDKENHVYIYPDFSKPLPKNIHENKHLDGPTAEELIRGLWLLASVPDSDYFLFMSFRNGQRFFRFLDTQGNWHQTLPAHIPFTVVRPSGDIIWPAREHYISTHEVPEGWKIDRMSALKDDSIYHVALSKDKVVRQGIWDAEKKKWLIFPKYYQVYAMNNSSLWRFQETYEGLWGVMNADGEPLIKPIYSSISADGWVQAEENGKHIRFYLHPQTLKVFREK